MTDVKLNTAQVRAELRAAIPHLRSRGLTFACKWASEQLLGAPLPPTEQELSTESFTDPQDVAEDDVYSLALSFFDLREHIRAAHALKGCKGPRSLFLSAYARFLAGEKTKEEKALEQNGPLAASGSKNEALTELCDELTSIRDAEKADGYLLYLLGVIQRESGKPEAARESLLASIRMTPCNYSAWQDLALLCQDKADVSSLDLPEHWMRYFFLAHVLIELQRNAQALTFLDFLSQTFPQSNEVLAKRALASYNLREFDVAQDLFDELQDRDPYRLENLDAYSNILYVKERAVDLSHLAHKANRVDKFRPETCCIIGNYYSIKGEHDKAILYFQRALRLNKNYLSAWTLMGHEYVEMRNTPAAVEAYRRAVEVNPRDYRAWYGLGQTYELLQLPYYALYYYRKATHLRPYDSRMWCAMAGCYENLSRIQEAIDCYERADNNTDRERIALHKLASLYRHVGSNDQAAFYYKKNLDRRDEEQLDGKETTEALLFLAEYCRDQKRFDEAEKYCTRLLDVPGTVSQDAKAILLEVRGQNPGGRSSASRGLTVFGDKFSP